MTGNKLLLAAKAYKKQNPPKYGLEGVLAFTRQISRSQTDPNSFTEKDWLKVFDEFGVSSDAEKIALLENVAAWL